MKAELSSQLVEATIQCGFDDPSASICCKLPNDIILIILHYLYDYKDLLAVASVSRRWLILASESSLWRSLYEFNFGPETELTFINRSWKFNFHKRIKKQLSLFYSRKKNPQIPISTSHNNHPTLTFPEDPQLLAFLAEKKQFFDSFESISLVTTPYKKKHYRSRT